MTRNESLKPSKVRYKQITVNVYDLDRLYPVYFQHVLSVARTMPRTATMTLYLEQKEEIPKVIENLISASGAWVNVTAGKKSKLNPFKGYAISRTNSTGYSCDVSITDIASGQIVTSTVDKTTFLVWFFKHATYA